MQVNLMLVGRHSPLDGEKMNLNPSKDEIDYINKSLEEYNNKIVGPDSHELLNIVEYNGNHEIIGGLLGGTYWGWLYISILWVDEKYRHQGIGKKLIAEAEQEAEKRGCKYAHVDTMSFQAPKFYKKLHYKVIGVVNDIPEGQRKYHLIKKLK
jgi:ribosomal protein S18 acetylase RimI-like enzyme